MFKKTNSSKEHNLIIEKQEKSVNHLFNRKDEQCHCNKSYKIIENYRSILDRKQTLISSWKILDQNGNINFTRGNQHRKGTDALVIRSNDVCLINPWYKYIDVNKHIVKQNQYEKVLEIVLLDCHRSINSKDYEFAIIECPCLEQLKTYCTYCRLTLAAMEQSDTLLPTRMMENVAQQTNISLPLDFLNDGTNINDSFYSRLGPYRYQRTVQIQVLHDITDYDVNFCTIRRIPNAQQQSPLSQAFDENVDSSLSETKLIARLQDSSSQSIIENDASHSSISLLFRSTTSKLSSHSQDAIEPNEDSLFGESTFEPLTKYLTRGTQTKLYAILLPPSPLSEMKKAKTETKTSMIVTRTCQVNTLSYLIKTNEALIQVQHPIEDICSGQQMNPSSTISFLYNETQLMNEGKVINIEPSTEINRQQEASVLTIEFEGGALVDDFEVSSPSMSKNEEILLTKELIMASPPSKCINACDNIDLNEPSTPVTSSVCNEEETQTWKLTNKRAKKYCRPINTTNLEQVKIFKKSYNNSHVHIIKHSNNNNKSDQFDHLPSDNYQISKLSPLKTNHYRMTSRKRRRYRNKQCVYRFIQRLYRQRKRNAVRLHISKHHSLSCSSSFIITDDRHNQCEHRLLFSQTNSTKHNTSPNQRQQSVIDVHLNNSDSYQAHNHTIIARTSKASRAGKQIQTLLSNQNTSLEQLISSQLILTCNDDYRSVCILIDDHKQSEQYRSSFLQCIYTTLSNTLKKSIENQSIQLTCMNLVFFNNSLCDIVNMQRLRLIDTGRKRLLLPSCEISLRTSDDINTAINRLSTEMTFAHQIFIINCYHKRSFVSGSFLFLQLAPICSIRSTGLLNNLNSATYSVLNLIRQLSNGRVFNDDTRKRYLLNDCLLNRLLKNYLFSRQQTMTVFTVKPKL